MVVELQSAVKWRARFVLVWVAVADPEPHIADERALNLGHAVKHRAAQDADERHPYFKTRRHACAWDTMLAQISCASGWH